MNGHLVIDIGGVHRPVDRTVTFTKQFGDDHGMVNMGEYAPHTRTITRAHSPA